MSHPCMSRHIPAYHVMSRTVDTQLYKTDRYRCRHSAVLLITSHIRIQSCIRPHSCPTCTVLYQTPLLPHMHGPVSDPTAAPSCKLYRIILCMHTMQCGIFQLGECATSHLRPRQTHIALLHGCSHDCRKAVRRRMVSATFSSACSNLQQQKKGEGMLLQGSEQWPPQTNSSTLEV